MPLYLFIFWRKIFFISAKQHGYDYLRITAPPIPEHYNTWTKVVQLYHIIHKYDIVVLLDADAFFVNSNISVEFLLSRYNFTVNSSLLMPADPNFARNKDSKGRIALNTGFIIAQNNNLTKHILKKLALCTKTIPGCDKWKNRWSHEQRSFSDYIRDEMKIGSELIIAPCNELNGFTGSGEGCSGIFVTNVPTQKHTVVERLQNRMMNTLMTLLENAMWGNNHSLIALTSDINKLEAQNNNYNISGMVSKH
jgi:galactosyl transferase GMA12/MNN10 family